MAKTFSILIVLAAASICCSAVSLESYNADPTKTTISGLSSGGAMVMQFHLAFSKDVHGAAIFAGLPFGCAKSGLTGATMCMTSPGTSVNVNNIIKDIDSLASSGKLDPTDNIKSDPVFIVHGTKDTTVNPTAGKKIEEVYQNYGVNIKTNFEIVSVHGFPTDFYGAACGSSSAGTQYINNCNYHGAYEALQHLYQGETLLHPSKLPGSVRLNGELIEFEQKEFITALTAAAVSMDAHGFVYVPSGCKDRTTKCRLHIAFHGCSQTKATIGNIYATKTGFLEVGELNNIIVLFPQATANMLSGNPNGCWDWWGYLNANFLNKDGAQMQAVHKMLNRIVNCDGASDCYDDVTNPPATVSTAPPAETTAAPPGETTPQVGTTAVPGECQANEVSFHPFPGKCDYYTICACGVQVLQQCAPGLYFDSKTNQCNFIQLVDCSA